MLYFTEDGDRVSNSTFPRLCFTFSNLMCIIFMHIYKQHLFLRCELKKKMDFICYEKNVFKKCYNNLFEHRKKCVYHNIKKVNSNSVRGQ